MGSRLRITGIMLAALGMSAGVAGSALARDRPDPGWTAVHYRGATVRVPRGWRAYDLRAHPGMCVRFDRPAVYLGRPAPRQDCPAVGAGRPRAILIEPRGSGAVVIRRAADTIAASSGQPDGRTSSAGAQAPAARSASAATSFTGLGFDACTAPSAGTMRRWGGSPYRAIGVYIGGTNMACAQPNLTAPWVSQQTAAGWHLILIYVGLQAPGNSCGCASIDPARASAQGRAAATDAISRAGALGIGPGNAIYNDMEAYSRGASTSVVMSFLAAWTQRLHADGYKSGVYSSSASGVSDLAARYRSSYPEPDDIWFAEWNDRSSTSSSYIPAGDWLGHRRLHQYRGDHNETFGGVTLNIDSDAVDGGTAAYGRTSLIPDGRFIQLTSTRQVFRIAGGAPLYVHDLSALPAPASYLQVSPQQFAALPRVPLDGTFVGTPDGVLYRVAGGAPFVVTQSSLFVSLHPVEIDSWDLEHLSDPRAHLNAAPADGTVLQGLPSRGYWIFTGGERRRTTSAPAIQVDDAGLAAYPMKGCLVPRLLGLTLGGVRGVLRQTDCRLGQVVRHGGPAAGHPLRVIGQFPAAGSRRPPLTTVQVTMG